MTNQQAMTPIKGDYSDSELRTIMATLTGRDPDDVCEIAAVIIYHGDGGVHQVTVMTDTQDGASRAAATLLHAAEHILGTCKRCARVKRKRAKNDAAAGS